MTLPKYEGPILGHIPNIKLTNGRQSIAFTLGEEGLLFMTEQRYVHSKEKFKQWCKLPYKYLFLSDKKLEK